VAVCPARILFLNEKGFPEDIPEGQCILCGHCAAVCAHDALTHTGLAEETYLPIAKEPLPPAVMDGFLMSRRSVREFKDRPVGREVLEALLEVARRAPTGSNSQKLHWIVVEGVRKVYALSEEAMNWFRTTDLPKARLEQWEKGHDFILRGAPAVIVACAPADYVWAKQDCAIALTFLELAAEARSLGVCWTGYLTRAAAAHSPLCKALSVPEGHVVCGGLMIGERKYTYKKIPPRKPLSVQWL
jgi:nitroreductase